MYLSAYSLRLWYLLTLLSLPILSSKLLLCSSFAPPASWLPLSLVILWVPSTFRVPTTVLIRILALSYFYRLDDPRLVGLGYCKVCSVCSGDPFSRCGCATFSRRCRGLDYPWWNTLLGVPSWTPSRYCLGALQSFGWDWWDSGRGARRVGLVRCMLFPVAFSLCFRYVLDLLLTVPASLHWTRTRRHVDRSVWGDSRK